MKVSVWITLCFLAAYLFTAFVVLHQERTIIQQRNLIRVMSQDPACMGDSR